VGDRPTDGAARHTASSLIRHTPNPPPSGPLVFVERRRHPVPDHEHKLPRSLQVLVILCFVGLLASIVLVSVQARETNQRLDRLEQYVAGRGEFRDAEVERQDEAFRRGICDVLAQLTGNERLDELRAKYDCRPAPAPTP
jgi:hypothetical protein